MLAEVNESVSLGLIMLDRGDGSKLGELSSNLGLVDSSWKVASIDVSVSNLSMVSLVSFLEFADVELLSMVLLSIHGGNGFLCFFILLELNESEAF